MQPLKKGMLVIGAPLGLVAVLGGAVAFASQAGGSGAPRESASVHHHVHMPGDSTAAGTECPDKAAGASTDPAVY